METSRRKKSRAGIIAKDSDLLEAAFTAREYKEKGVPLMDLWLKNYLQFLKTETAKQILNELIKIDLIWWWKDLKEY